jgi:hypothetical protein
MNYSLLLKQTLFLLVLTIVFIGSSLAQSKEAFQKIFEKETQQNQITGYGKFRNIDRVSFYPDTLPSWFFTPPRSTDEIIYAIGVSDPDLTPEEAIFQAMHRAKALAVLYSRAQLQYYRDVYTIEFNQGRYKDYGQRFDTYFKLSGSAYADSNCFKVERNQFNRYNEAIVLVSYQPNASKASSKSEQITTIATALYIETQIGNVFEPQAEYEFSMKHSTARGYSINSNFTYREKAKRYLAISEFMGKYNNYPIYNYKYTDPRWEKNTQPLISYNGLWSIYSKKFLRFLTLDTEETSVNIRSLGEQYSPEMRNLSREVAIKTARININGIEFGVDSIGFNIDLIELR